MCAYTFDIFNTTTLPTHPPAPTPPTPPLLSNHTNLTPTPSLLSAFGRCAFEGVGWCSCRLCVRVSVSGVLFYMGMCVCVCV